MILESAQLLSGALHWSGCDHPDLYDDAHPNGHQCKDWTMANRENFLWLVELARQLHIEWQWRGFRTHKSAAQVELCASLADAIVHGTFSPPPLAMDPMFYRHDPVEAYRNYYCGAKAWFPVVRKQPHTGFKVRHWVEAHWRRREPEWWQPYQEQPELEIL